MIKTECSQWLFSSDLRNHIFIFKSILNVFFAQAEAILKQFCYRIIPQQHQRANIPSFISISLPLYSTT